jgi:hypothetical protein
MSAPDAQTMTVEQATEEFHKTKKGVLLIDSSLI